MFHRASRPRRRVAAALVIGLLAAALAAPAIAGEEVPRESRTYRVTSYAPTTADCQDAGVERSIEVELFNNGQGGQELGSANLTPGFEVRSVSAVTVRPPSGPVRTVAARVVDGTRVELRNLRARPGSTVSFSFVGTPEPLTPYTLVDGVSLAVKQSNEFQGEGNDLAPRGTMPTFTLEPCFDLDGFDDVDRCAAGETCAVQTTELVELDGVAYPFVAEASGTAVGAAGALGIAAGPTPGETCDPRPAEVPGSRQIHRIPAEVEVVGFGTFDAKTVILRIPRELDQSATNNGVAQYEICAQPLRPPESEFSRFHDRFSGELVDFGEYGYLPDCEVAGRAPCVRSRAKEGGAPVLQVDTGSRFKLT